MMKESDKQWNITDLLADETRKNAHKETWEDNLEALKFTTRVFSRLNDVITEDFVLATLSEEQKEFVREQVKQAILLRRLLPDKHVGETLFTMLVAESIMVAVLNRNVDRNVLLKIIGRVKDDDIDGSGVMDEPPRTIGGRIMDKGRKMLG